MAKRAKSSKSIEEKKAEVKGLLSTLEEGVEALQSSDGWQRWLDFQANLYSYSWNNTWLIASQLPEATIVMGYRAWQANGRQVRRGEKGIRILAPCFRKVEGNDGEEKRLCYFRAVSVFDISQTEGEEVPSPCQKLEEKVDGNLFGLLRECSERRGVPVRLEAIQGPVNGYYDRIGKFIAVKESNPLAQRTKTLAHEIGHSILHSDLSRDEQSRQDRELEAESVAYIVCRHFGLDTSDYSFGYIAQWKGGEAKEGFKKSAKRISDAAKETIELVEAVIDGPAQKAA